MKKVLLSTVDKRQLTVFMAESVLERVRGLFAVDIDTVDGLLIKPCGSVHTLGMRYAIDLVYLDKQRRIIKVVHRLKPWRMSMRLGADSVAELREGTAKALGLETGHILQFH